MTKDNSGMRNDKGEPGYDLEPADVVLCRECGNAVRRVNNQHLQTDRCRFTDQDEFHREDKKRQNHPETVEEYKEKFPDAPVIAPAERANLQEKNSDPEVDERRREMMRRRWSGESMNNIVESVANRYDVTESAIWKDWAKRDKWMGRVFNIGDAEAVVVEALAQKTNVREELVDLAQRAKSENEIDQAIRALKAVDSNIDDTIEHQQELGRVKKAVDKKQVEHTGEVTHNHNEEPGEGLSEEQLRNIDAVTDGEDEEVIDAEYREVDE